MTNGGIDWTATVRPALTREVTAADRFYAAETGTGPELQPGASGESVVNPDVMYSASGALQEGFTGQVENEQVVLGLSAEERAARHREHATFIESARLDPYRFGNELYSLRVSADLADHRGDEEDQARYRADAEDTRRQLIAKYGADEVDALLARAKKFVDASPYLSQLLARRGIGNRPGVVLPIVEHVRRENLR